jgi:hypothetical protein
MNSPIATYKPQNELTPAQTVQEVAMGFGSSQGFELMQRGAKLLAASTLIPKDYQGNFSNCVVALNMANRLGADPLMVMQNLYVVHNRPSWSAQFLIASFNQCGNFSAIRYKWSGTEGQDDWGCQAYATERANSEVITGPLITIALSKKEGWFGKSGSKWQTIPQLMLMYRAAAWLVRTHAPEISMGLQTAEEVHDVYDEAKDIGSGVSSGTAAMRDKIGKLSADNPVIEGKGETIDTKTGEVITASTEKKPTAADKPEPIIKYGDVAGALQTAKNIDELNEAADLIRSVENKVHKQQLSSIYDERSAALSGEEKL